MPQNGNHDTGNNAVTPSLVERESKGNIRLTVIVVFLSVLVVALGISLFVYLARSSTGAQTAGDAELRAAQDYLASHEKDPFAYERLARVQGGIGHGQDALDTLEKGLNTTKSGSLYLPLGDVYRSMKRYPDAIAAYGRAEGYQLKTLGLPSIEGTFGSEPKTDSIQGDQFLFQTYYGRALCEVVTKDVDKAQKDLELALALIPESAEAWATLGDLQLSTGDNEGAVAAYNTALKYIPDYQRALEGLERAQGGN